MRGAVLLAVCLALGATAGRLVVDGTPLAQSSGSSSGTSSGTSSGGSSQGRPPPTSTATTTATTTPTTERTGTTGAPASPTSTSSIAEDRVQEGAPTGCGTDAPEGTQCYEVRQGRDTEAVRIPDGDGGFLVVPLAPAPVSVDTGASTSAASNADLRIQVDVEHNHVVRVERRPSRAQRALTTVLALIILVIAAYMLGQRSAQRRGGTNG